MSVIIMRCRRKRRWKRADDDEGDDPHIFRYFHPGRAGGLLRSRIVRILIKSRLDPEVARFRTAEGHNFNGTKPRRHPFRFRGARRPTCIAFTCAAARSSGCRRKFIHVAALLIR